MAGVETRGGRSRLAAIGRAAGRAFLLLLAVGWLATPPPARAEHVLDAPRALALEGAGDLVIIDVRTAGEWAETGVPRGAAQICLFTAPGTANANFIGDVLAAVGGDRTRSVATICATGRRSSLAQELLAGNGFTAVYTISEGMLGSNFGPGWLGRGLPVEPCANC